MHGALVAAQVVVPIRFGNGFEFIYPAQSADGGQPKLAVSDKQYSARKKKVSRQQA
jgi:hypothetical protein